MTRPLLAALAFAVALASAGAPASAGSPRLKAFKVRVKRALTPRSPRKRAERPEWHRRAVAERGRWEQLAARRDPSSHARSPFRFSLRQFKGRGGVRAGRVEGEPATVRWVERDVALVGTASGPAIFLPTADLDPDVARLVHPGARIVVEVEPHPAGGVIAVNPRAP